MDDISPSEFTEVKPSNWNKNKNKSTESSITPIPTYLPTTQWPTYTPTTVEDKAEWLRRKQKYLKNRDKIPDSVWEEDEKSFGKKKQLWLEKQKDKKKEEEEEVVSNSIKQNTEEQQQEEQGTGPTPTPTYYDPPVLPTRKQNQLEKREKLAAQQQNTTINNEASDSFTTPSPAPTLLASSSGIPTISDIPAVQAVQEIPTKRQQHKAEKQAQLAAEKLNNSTITKTQESTLNNSTITTTQESAVSSTSMSSSRYTGGSRSPRTPGSRGGATENDSQEEETKGTDTVSSFEPEVLETKEESEPGIMETNERPEKSSDEKAATSNVKSNNNDVEATASQKVSLTIPAEELKKLASAREAPKPTPAPVKPTSTVKVNFTFINNRAKKKKLTPAPTPAVASSEPTYLLFPTNAPTEPRPTYAPTAVWTWSPSLNKDRKKTADKSLFDKRTCPSDNLFFESESHASEDLLMHAPTEPRPTYAPTAVWTWSPSLNKDRKKTADKSLFDKRTCPSDNLFFESESHASEEKGGSVFFTYGIQTSNDGNIEEAVEKIQLWLLGDVASKLLHCPKNSNGFVMRSNTDFGIKEGQGVLSSVYYSKDDRQYAKQCNTTTSKANMCAIVSSTLRFDAVDQDVQARSKVLAVIFNQLQSGFGARLEEANILDLVYLGPELGYQQPDDVEVKDTPTSSSRSPTSMYAVIGVASSAVFALLLCLAMRYKLRKERRRRMPSVTSSYHRDEVSNYRDAHHENSYSYTQRRSYYR